MAKVNTLDTLQTTALRTGDMELFDQITSEQQLGNGTAPVNARLLELFVPCYVCGSPDYETDAKERARLRAQGWCDRCNALAKYMDAALSQGFKAKALQFAEDSPTRERLRQAYRRIENRLRNMRARRDAARERGTR